LAASVSIARCGSSICHSAPGNSGAYDLVLTRPTSINLSSLLNQPSAKDPSVMSINTANEPQSALLTQLASNPPYGSSMPFGGPLLEFVGNGRY
jgi:hypothetical protein